jgi:5-methylcytosine-specific restriction endonuclease McrA
MNKFFVPDAIYEDRIAICKGCVYYKKLLGNCSVCKCFMKIKARIAPMSCPQKYWDKTTEVTAPDDLPQELIDEDIRYVERLKNR